MIRTRGALLVLILAIVGLLVVPWLGEPSAGQTSYSGRPSGFRAFRTLASEYRAEVSVWRGLPTRLTGQGSALLLLQPIGSMLEQSEYRQALLDWTAAGNDLILSPRAYDTQVSRAFKQTIELRSSSAGGLSGLNALLEAADLPSITSTHSGSSFNQKSSATAATHALEVDGVGEYQVEFEAEYVPTESSQAWTSFARMGGRPFALRAEHGEGQIVLLLGSSAFTNFKLQRADHAAACLALLQPFGKKALLFDEFFHGLPSLDTLGALLTSPRLLPLSLICLFTLLAIVFAGSVRRMPLRAVALPSRRSKREHLFAMGQLIANGREGMWVSRALYQGGCRELAAALHLPEHASEELLFAGLLRRQPELAERFRELSQSFARIEAAASGPLANESQSWGRAWMKLRRQVVEAYPKAVAIPSS